MRRLVPIVSIMLLQVVSAGAASTYSQNLQGLIARQSEDGLIPMPSSPSGGLSPLWGMALSLFLVVCVLAISLMPSKRGHQD